MSHKYTLTLSRPLKRKYIPIGVNEGDDVTIIVPDIDDIWVGQGYNLTIYDEKDRSTLASVSIVESSEEIQIDDFSFDTKKALVVVEDRSDIDNIETIDTIAYIYFKKFSGGTTAATQEGTINYINADDSNTAIPYYSTGFSV